MANDRLMPESCLRELPCRIMKPHEVSPVLAWPFEDRPSLPLVVLSENGEQWHTRLCGVSITLPNSDAHALVAWLALAQRLGCLLALDDQESGRWRVRSAHQIEVVAVRDGYTQLRLELERLDI